MSALLRIESLCVALGGRRVVYDVSLEVRAGEIVALLGPNGAGKTSLMRASLGLIAPARGGVSLGDASVQALSARQRALRAAYLPQRPASAWAISIEALVALGRYAYGASPQRLSAGDAEAVEAALVACGLDTLRARRMDEVSGGEAMRAHLARAMAQRAPLLVLDEPTAGLDPAQALAAADILKAHAKGGGAVLVSTHDVALAARISDRVALMKAGAMLSVGAPEAALTSEALAAAYGRAGRLARVDGSLVAVFE